MLQQILTHRNVVFNGVTPWCSFISHHKNIIHFICTSMWIHKKKQQLMNESASISSTR